jgi:hypothetical protein
MITKYKLTSTLSTLFVYIIYTIGIGIFFFLIYSIITIDIPGIITCLALELFFYIKFYRLFLKFKNIMFDFECIYFDNESIPFKNITEIKKGKITYIKKDIKNSVYYNYFYGINYNQLNNFYHSENNSHIHSR